MCPLNGGGCLLLHTGKSTLFRMIMGQDKPDKVV
jgi:hypothetical protein